MNTKKTVKDFRSWLSFLDDDFDNAHDVWHSVTYNGLMGLCETKENRGKYFVYHRKYPDVLMLVSARAKETFLEMLEKRYGGQTGIAIAWQIQQMEMAD